MGAPGCQYAPGREERAGLKLELVTPIWLFNMAGQTRTLLTAEIWFVVKIGAS